MKSVVLPATLVILFNLSSAVNSVIKAQVVPIGSAAQAAQTNTITSFTAPAGTSRVLIVTVSDALSTNITSATFNGMTMTEKAEHTDGNAVDAFYTLALGTSAGTMTGDIVVTSANVSNTGKFITARVFEKVDQTTPLTGIQAADNSGPASSSFNIISANGSLVYDIFDTFNSSSGGTRTAGGGQTIMHSSGPINIGGFAFYSTSTKAGASSVTMSWTTNHEFLIHIAASIQFSSLLPVTLLSFTALLQQNDVLLNWKTMDATNFSHFEIERSMDGITFGAAGSRQALTGGGDIEYNLNDINAAFTYRGNNKIYYRLKIVDADGSYSYSKIVQVQLSPGKGLFVISTQPNPFTGNISISLSMKEKDIISIKLIDMAGRIVSNKQLMIAKGFSTQSIESLEKLNKGVYSLQVQSGSLVTTAKVVKQ